MMLKTIFTKTLYEKRFTALGWSLGLTFIILVTMSVYRTFSQAGSLGDSLTNLPKSLQSIVGDSSSFKTIPGFVGQQLFALRIPLIMIICGLITATGLLVGEEADGTLQTLLAMPISRSRIYLEKLLALLAILAVIALATVVATELGLLLIHESLNLARLLQAAFGAWLIVSVFSVFALSIGAITGRKGLTTGLSAAFTFGSYFLTSLAPAVSSLRTLDKISPFHYYNSPVTTQYGLNGEHLLVLAGLIVVMVIVSLLVFTKRDIYAR